MYLVLLIFLTMTCMILGAREPLFLLGAAVLFAWTAIVVFIRGIRWLLGLTAPAATRGNGTAGGALRTRLCPETRCGRVNLGHARFCAQCGRRLA